VSEATDEWEREGQLRKYLRHFIKVNGSSRQIKRFVQKFMKKSP